MCASSIPHVFIGIAGFASVSYRIIDLTLLGGLYQALNSIFQNDEKLAQSPLAKTLVATVASIVLCLFMPNLFEIWFVKSYYYRGCAFILNAFKFVTACSAFYDVVFFQSAKLIAPVSGLLLHYLLLIHIIPSFLLVLAIACTTPLGDDLNTLSEEMAVPPPRIVLPSPDNLEAITYTAEEEQANLTICAICLEKYEISEKVHKGICGHDFHFDCLRGWEQASCPICRAPDFRKLKSPPLEV